MSEQHSVDFLRKKYNLLPDAKNKKRSPWKRRIVGVSFVLIACIGIVSSYKLRATTLDPLADEVESFSIVSTFRRLVGSEEKVLVGEEDDRINFLLLGHGGAGHDGPELTDTIMFASWRPSTNEIGIMSIPRDMVVPIDGYGYRKVNHVNAYAEIEEEGSGPEETANALEEILGQEIHYYAKVDFDGFQELIDAVGGVDVYVERSFTDYTYPTDDDLVQTVSFTQGWTEMDGETALQFSRSRHGTNGEGSDFARAERQQKIIFAVKDKLLSASTLLNPGRLNGLLETVQDNVETNLSFWEMMKLARLVPDIDTESINHLVLDASAESPLYPTTINGAYVLLPKKDDWSDISSLATNIFTDGESNDSTTPSEHLVQESVRLEIQNGTAITGLAFQTSQLLMSSGFDVVEIGNADTKSYERTVIYDLTEGEKSEALALLKEFLEADVSMSPTGWIYADEVVPRELTVDEDTEALAEGEEVDFLIIIGENTADFVMR